MATKQAPSGSPEADALADICAWAEKRPPWQREALRMLCEQHELSENDINALANICLGKEKALQPLQPEHVQKPKAAASTVQLTAIHSVENVNDLALDQNITFSGEGLTVVYGDNGSGKSGYARVLKTVCRARMPKGERVLPNVYATPTGVPTAEIEYTVNGEEREPLKWRENAQPQTGLSAIGVFDSAAASIHVNRENDVAYTPFPVQLLERLASACTRVGDALKDRIGAIERLPPPSIRPTLDWQDTAAGKCVLRLCEKTYKWCPESLEELAGKVESLAGLTDKEMVQLEAIQGDLERDPKVSIRDIEKNVGQLQDFLRQSEGLRLSVSVDSCQSLHEAWRACDDAKNASTAAAEKLFRDCPLSGVGSETWVKLWEAARRYSEQEAYRGEKFPFVDESAKCVLCQQALPAPSRERMSSFEAFVKNETKKKEQEMCQRYRSALDAFEGGWLSCEQVRRIVGFLANDVRDLPASRVVREFFSKARWTHRKIRRHHQKASQIKIGDLPASPIPKLVADLRQRKEVLESEAQSEKRKQQKSTYAELVARQRLYEIKNDVLDAIARKQEIACISESLRDTKTNAITSKSSEIAEQLITSSLCSRFSEEMKALNKTGLAVKLEKAKTSHGASLFRVALCNQLDTDAKIAEILSEGEFRCVALAVFLAELATSTGESAIIFDDPVSSFDHVHRDTLARRLAVEGKNRQVIVFTHDLVFLNMLREHAKRERAKINCRSITKRLKPGICHLDVPGPKHVKCMIQVMEKQLNREKARYEKKNKPDEEWRKEVKSLYAQLREAWELAVEGVVSPVLQRFSDRVTIWGLKELTVISEDDCTTMHAAYDRCSKWMHSEPDSVNRQLPKPCELEEEIGVIKKWTDNLRDRRRRVEKSAKA